MTELSDTPRSALLRRLRDDFVFFAETCLKVRDKQTKRMVSMRLRPAQIRLAQFIVERYLAGEPVRVMVLKARQEGVSTLTQAILFWLCATRADQLSLTVTQHDDTTGTIFGISENFWIHMPASVRPKKRFTKRSKEMVFANPSKDPDILARSPGLNSELRTVSAKNAGVGAGVLLVHCSEVALWESESQIDAKKTLETLFQVVPMGPGTIIVLESTARGVGNEFHRRWKAAERHLAAGERDFYPFFIPWMEEPEYALDGSDWDGLGELDHREQRLVERYDVTAGQVAWRRMKIRMDFGGDADGFDQEYPESADVAFLASGRPFFDQDVLVEAIDQLEAEPPVPLAVGDIVEDEEAVSVRERRRGPLTIWEAPHEDDDYLIVCDPSEGSDGDPQAVVVLARSTLREVAAWHGYIDRGDLGDVLYRLGVLYNTALVTVERQGGWGLTPLNVLKRRGYPRIHRRIEEGKRQRKRNVRLGFDMTETNRALVLDSLREALREGELDTKDVAFLKEALVFEYGPNGKPQAQVGAHDDRVIVRAIGVWMWQTEPRRRRHHDEAPHRRVLSGRTGY